MLILISHYLSNILQTTNNFIYRDNNKLGLYLNITPPPPQKLSMWRGNVVLCISTRECMLAQELVQEFAWSKTKKGSKIIKNILFSSCARGAHIRLM